MLKKMATLFAQVLEGLFLLYPFPTWRGAGLQRTLELGSCQLVRFLLLLSRE